MPNEQPTLATQKASEPPSDFELIRNTLKELMDLTSSPMSSLSDFKGRKATHFKSRLEFAIDLLSRAQNEMSPAKQPSFVLDPSEPSVVGKLVAETLLRQDRQPLNAVPKVYGSGVYAIYFTGDFDAYRPISSTDIPIYVGKADPAIPQARNPKEQGERLTGRLNDHKKNIDKADNLSLSDFECRFLVVTSGWQVAAEIHLLSHFHPLWNDPICYGFGKHGDKHTTRSNTRSPWDTLHPGRKWATEEGNTPNPLSIGEIKALISEHFELYGVTPLL